MGKLPLDFQTIPCKPLFYDIAGKFVAETDYQHRIKKEKEKVEKKAATPKQPTNPGEDTPQGQEDAQPAKGWFKSWFS
eukprot:NODE_5590_length_281_cov_35.956897_g5507_i0.p3 GENE.NODE_5590_length_281_cov_35.956897_g5507_i0~~NODE_5590_length_281_cov_35.956897_g5507_i0.p3  ORF type:complete len:78 (-),score=25.73 NODE_5590_length_281_cov_35.956897_g5507_i0:15-248(-)